MTNIKRNLNRTQSREAIAAHEDFTNSGGSMRGVTKPITIGRGELNDAEYETLCSHIDTFGIAYVVYSYETPIAWILNDGSKYRVEQWFSRTTSKHMGLTWVSDYAKVEA